MHRAAYVYGHPGVDGMWNVILFKHYDTMTCLIWVRFYAIFPHQNSVDKNGTRYQGGALSSHVWLVSSSLYLRLTHELPSGHQTLQLELSFTVEVVNHMASMCKSTYKWEAVHNITKNQ